MLLLFMLLPVVASAASALNSIALTTANHVESVQLSLSEKTAYQVYELSAPNRLVITLTDTAMKPGLKPIAVDGEWVHRINLRPDTSGLRVELLLAGNPKHRIEERGSDLLIHVSGTQTEATVRPHAILKDIEVREHAGVTEVYLRGEHMDASSNAFVTNDGKTLIVDFWEGESRLAKEHFSYASHHVRDITVGAADGRLRLVFGMVSGVDNTRQIESSPQQWRLRLGQLKLASKEHPQTVESVNFVPDDKAPHLVIQTRRSGAVVDISQQKDHVTIDISKAGLAEGLERTLDVSAFPGPVKQIDSYRRGDGVRIVARLREKVSLTSFQSGNVLTLNFEPEGATLAQGVAGGENQPMYHGEKVSFDFKDIDIRNALKLIAEMSDLNIIMGDDVSGTLTMRLIDVPWDQALDLILSSRGLGKIQEGNVVRIAPLSVLQEEYAAKLKARATTQELEPLVTEFIHLGYASVADIKTMIENAPKHSSAPAGGADNSGAASEDSGEGGLALMSSRGSLLMDERRNILIVTDTERRVNNIKRLISVLDKPVQQVLIESRIVEATNSFTRDIGIKWGGTYNDQAVPGNRFGHKVGGGIGGNLVDLPAQGPTGAIVYNLGTLSNVLNLNLELSAAEADQKIKVLSNPRVLTSNHREARIEQILEIPFTQTEAQGGVLVTSTIVREAKLSLIVTPQITVDNKIIMDIEIHKDTPQANNLKPGGDPLINKKTLKTKLLVENGETVVLGGIYSKTVSKTKNAVPGFSDIPILGLLFQRNQKEDQRVELMLFITPTLVSSGGQEVTQQED